MKTLKFRLIEHVVKKGFSATSEFSIQYKTGLLWQNYKVDKGGEWDVKKFDTPKDCIDEIFNESKYKKTELKLKEYPRLKFITLKLIKQ